MSDPVYGYARGEELGCPECLAGEPHVCPFLEADRMLEPQRSWVLAHLNKHLGEVFEEGKRSG